MDLIAYSNTQNELINKYIQKNYGNIPRMRGVRFMKLEEIVQGKPNYDVTDMFKEKNNIDYTENTNMFNKYVGQDVIYIHTRCGNCDTSYDDKTNNYNYYGAREWEEKYSDLFLEHITDAFDSTYCTHYFKAVINDDYKEILRMIEE